MVAGGNLDVESLPVMLLTAGKNLEWKSPEIGETAGADLPAKMGRRRSSE